MVEGIHHTCLYVDVTHCRYTNNQRTSEMHPSCIKVPGSKESPLNPIPSTKDTDIRDQVCSRNDLITMANEVFGNAKWSHAVTNQTLDFVEYVTGKYYVGCAAFVKVQLGDGSFHEDMGYSNSEGLNKGLAIYSARTGSITNALKNTLLSFGGEIAVKIKNFVKFKTNLSSSIISAIGEPQQIIIDKSKINPPQAQSTPEEKHSSCISIVSGTVKNNNKEDPLVNNNEKKLRSPAYFKPAAENGVQVDKAELTEEEKRLERKRRQAQKQEEYRKLREKESAEKRNARF